MAGNPQDHPDDKPLDPSVERVRRKLVRFIGINLAILFLALMAVVGALVYRSGQQPAPQQRAGLTPPTGDGTVERMLALPAGARVLSQSLDSGRLSLLLELASGGQAVHVVDIASGETVARFTLGQ